jgi:CheY-like chemotaxis protein
MVRRSPVALVVDDNAINRDLLDGIFEQIGWKTVLSESGQHALDVLRARSVDLVLLDLRMPDVRGDEVCRRIRSELGLTNLPVVASTAHGMSEDRDRMVAGGFDELLTKPLSIAAVRAVCTDFGPGAS